MAIRYREVIEKGWQIGSGPTGAICKTPAACLKGSWSMRRDASNVDAGAELALELRPVSAQCQSRWWSGALDRVSQELGLGEMNHSGES